jgi:hypothetical protein
MRTAGGQDHPIYASGFPNSALTHVAVTYDNTTGIAMLYINGTPASTSALGAFLPETSLDFYVGRRPWTNAPSYFSGVIDELSVFNVCLSANDIYRIFFAGSLGKCPPVDPALDSDQDGIPDWWELRYGSDPHYALDAGIDDDGDSLTRRQEYLGGTNPRVRDVMSIFNAEPKMTSNLP